MSGGQVAEKVGWKDAFDFAQVSGTLEGVAQAIRSGLVKVTPSKTTVELGIQLAVKNGKLTGLLVEGQADVSLKVTLEWGDRARRQMTPVPDGEPNPLIALFRQCVVCITDGRGGSAAPGSSSRRARCSPAGTSCTARRALRVRWQDHVAPVSVAGRSAAAGVGGRPGQLPAAGPGGARSSRSAERAGSHPCVALTPGQPVLGGAPNGLYLAGYTIEHGPVRRR